MALKISFVLFFFVSVVYGDKYFDDELRIHPYLPQVPLPKNRAVEQESEFWHDLAQSTLQAKLQEKLNTNKAKNIIMFIGDGMSLPTIAATRSFMGNESVQISFEKFPYVGLSKTYCVDAQVADSACTATAYFSGVKGNDATIGLNAHVKQNDCEKGIDNATFTVGIAKWAQDAGKDTGLVTTARVTHASPAGVYANIANRYWENDFEIRADGCDSNVIVDIAEQLIDWEVGKNLKVILGGGRAEFLNDTMQDEEGKPGWRTDGKNLLEKWLLNHKSMGNATYVWNRPGLENLDMESTDYLLGLFNPSHCSYHGDLKRLGRERIEPSLTEMTEAAIKMLRKNKNGYFLFVEGARIDMAHHDTKARKSLEDTEEMARAVQKARDMTSEEDTLIVVTSDHAHTMTINGYPSRGGDILGLSGNRGSDGLPYTSVSYANGPGYHGTYKKGGGGRRDLTMEDFTNANYEYPATAPLDSETHGGDDVGVFASGPYAHLFTGNYEQNVIPMLMAYAAEIGPYERSGAKELTFTIGLILSSLLLVFRNLL